MWDFRNTHILREHIFPYVVQYCQLPHFSGLQQKPSLHINCVFPFRSTQLKSVLCCMQLFPSFFPPLRYLFFTLFECTLFRRKKTQVVYIIAARHRESSVFISRSNMEKRILHTQKRALFSSSEVSPRGRPLSKTLCHNTEFTYL